MKQKRAATAHACAHSLHMPPRRPAPSRRPPAASTRQAPPAGSRQQARGSTHLEALDFCCVLSPHVLHLLQEEIGGLLQHRVAAATAAARGQRRSGGRREAAGGGGRGRRRPKHGAAVELGAQVFLEGAWRVGGCRACRRRCHARAGGRLCGGRQAGWRRQAGARRDQRVAPGLARRRLAGAKAGGRGGRRRAKPGAHAVQQPCRLGHGIVLLRAALHHLALILLPLRGARREQGGAWRGEAAAAGTGGHRRAAAGTGAASPVAPHLRRQLLKPLDCRLLSHPHSFRLSFRAAAGLRALPCRCAQSESMKNEGEARPRCSSRRAIGRRLQQGFGGKVLASRNRR